MYVCACICMYVTVCMYVGIQHVCMYMYSHVYDPMCVYVPVCVCLCVCVSVCVCASVCGCMNLYHNHNQEFKWHHLESEVLPTKQGHPMISWESSKPENPLGYPAVTKMKLKSP